MADIVQLYNDVDRSVGRAVRARRHARGLADADLASRLGMSLSDYRACEAGARRFGAERVLLLARALDTLPGCFFEELRSRRSAPEAQALSMVK